MSIQKRLMIVAGGDWQVPLIKKAKELGFYVINTNLFEDSIGFKYADVGEVADVLDKEKNLEIARRYKIDAVVTDQSDIAVPTVAYIAERLGIPGIGVDKAQLFTNKFLMREFCKDKGFLYPDYRLSNCIESVRDFAETNGFPFIIKPTNNQSSRGVHKINAMEELASKYQNTLKYSKDSNVLVEDFVGGIELTVEGIKTYETHYSLAVSRKQHLENNESVASRLFYTYEDKDIDYNALKSVHNRLVESMELPFGITHAEYKYYNGKFYLIEVAARGGGTNISSHIVPFLSGIDTNEMLIRMACGEKIEVLEQNNNNYSAVLEFFQFEYGKVKSIRGIDILEKLHTVIDYGLNFIEGDVLLPPQDDRSRHGYFIAYDKAKEDLFNQISLIKNTVEVEYE